MLHRFRVPFAAVGGASISIVFVSLAGIFAIERIGAQLGAVINPLTNEMISVVSPHQPLRPMVGVGILGALVTYCVICAPRKRSRVVRLVLMTAFSVTTIAQIIWGYASASPSGAWGDLLTGQITPGFQGWITNGSTDSSVHVVLFLSLGAMLLTGRNSTGPPSTEREQHH